MEPNVCSWCSTSASSQRMQHACGVAPSAHLVAYQNSVPRRHVAWVQGAGVPAGLQRAVQGKRQAPRVCQAKQGQVKHLRICTSRHRRGAAAVYNQVLGTQA